MVVLPVSTCSNIIELYCTAPSYCSCYCTVLYCGTCVLLHVSYRTKLPYFFVCSCTASVRYEGIPAEIERSETTLDHRHSLKTQTMTTTITDVHHQRQSSTNINSPLLTINEIDHIASNLTAVLSVEEVGSSDEFLKMYAVGLERCSIQAHSDAASSNNEEYVLESIVLHDKVTVLIRTLLAVEAWREFVLPEIVKCFECSSSNSDISSSSSECENKENQHTHTRHAVCVLRIAFTLHVETTLVGLLNLILYKYKCSEVGMDDSEYGYGIAVVDYCARRMAALAANPLDANEMVRRQKESRPMLNCTKKSQSNAEEIRSTCLESDFKTCIAATALARYLAEHVDDVPISVRTRMLDTHDFIMLMVPLIEEPPWTRRRETADKQVLDIVTTSKMVWEKYIDNEWAEVPSRDLLKITKCEAQCWFTLYFLTCSKSCRESYGLNSFRKEQMLRLRKYLNEVMTDQLPVLSDVMRYMDELALMNVPENATGHGSALMMQEVCMIRDSLLEKSQWEIISQNYFQSMVSRINNKTDDVLQEISSIYSEDGIERLLDDNESDFNKISNIRAVNIKFSDNGGSTLKNFHYKSPSDPGTAMNTPKGMYRRIKLGDFTNDRTCDSLVDYGDNMRVEIELKFEQQNLNSLKLNGELSLPKPLVVEISNEEWIHETGKISKTSRKKEWRQIGSLDDDLILQLCFQQNASKYQLLSTFISILEGKSHQ